MGGPWSFGVCAGRVVACALQVCASWLLVATAVLKLLAKWQSVKQPTCSDLHAAATV